MEVKCETYPPICYVEEKYDGQTYRMEFQKEKQDYDTNYWNVALGVYSKRKHIASNEDKLLITGKNPFYTVVFAKQAFQQIEKEIKERYCHKNNVIYVCWTDNKRRDAYYRVLSKWGYHYGTIKTMASDHQKCLIKRIDKNENCLYCG